MSPSPSEVTENPAPPTSPTPPSPLTMAGRLFSGLRPPTSPDSAPSPSSTSDPSPSPNRPDDADEAPISSTDAPPAETGPQAEPSGILSIGKAGRVSKAGLRTAIGGGVRRLCRLVAVYAATEEERNFGVWQPDPEDIEDIAEPAANLVYRRVPEEARGGDILDLFQLGLAVAGYVGKNLQRRAQLRTALNLQAAQGINVTESPGGGM
jgi:hypothetical protein